MLERAAATNSSRILISNPSLPPNSSSVVWHKSRELWEEPFASRRPKGHRSMSTFNVQCSDPHHPLSNITPRQLVCGGGGLRSSLLSPTIPLPYILPRRHPRGARCALPSSPFNANASSSLGLRGPIPTDAETDAGPYCLPARVSQVDAGSLQDPAHSESDGNRDARSFTPTHTPTITPCPGWMLALTLVRTYPPFSTT